MFGLQVFGVIDACYGLFGAQAVCQQAGSHVATLVGSDTDEQVGVGYVGFFQSGDGE